MAKPELGSKRLCASCGVKFYDLNKSPIACPKCGTPFEVVPVTPVTTRPRPDKRAASREPEVEAEEVEGAELISLDEADAETQGKRAEAAEDVEAAEAIEDTSDDPEVSLEKKDKSAALRQCLKKLSPEHREIIDLVYYHEKSVDDAAQILSIPSATVKTRMFYARKKLAELVQAA